MLCHSFTHERFHKSPILWFHTFSHVKIHVKRRRWTWSRWWIVSSAAELLDAAAKFAGGCSAALSVWKSQRKPPVALVELALVLVP